MSLNALPAHNYGNTEIWKHHLNHFLHQTSSLLPSPLLLASEGACIPNGVLCKVIHASVHAWSQLCRLIKKQTWLFSRNGMCRLSCLTSAMQPTSSGRAYPTSGHVERAFFEQQWISGNLNIHHFLFETSQTMNSNHCVHWTDWWQNSNRSMILFKYMFFNCLRTKKVTNDISRMADTCECFILVLPDISATFDTTDHQILG